MSVEMLGKYRNGNYSVVLLSNGTKIRRTEEDDFIPAFAENCDIKISDRCDGSCAWCYEGCSPQGKHGDILNQKFLDTLHPYTELALNGNDLSHPDLIPFLEKLRERKVIANMTVNQIHFEKHQEFIRYLIDEKLIYGMGISLREPTEEFVKLVQQYPNAVIHVINGVLEPADVEVLRDNNLKILILGYKHLRRGNDYYSVASEKIRQNQEWLKENLAGILGMFKVVSFDNLALEQLDTRRLLSDEEWEEFYMGLDGNFTYYIDLVEETFGRNSLATKRYPLLDSVDEMFEVIRNENVH